MANLHGMRLILFVISMALLACDETQLKTQPPVASTPEEVVDTPTTPDPLPDPEVPPVKDPSKNPVEMICSRLDFKDVNWPSTMTPDEHMQLALALNITGSFEGNVGWKNLAGNFDGQGISMGLMQQNLGQGTLQPLWIEMFQKDSASLNQYLSSAQKLSMQRMLETWRGSALPPALRAADHSLFPKGDSFNSLDENYFEIRAVANRNENSVAWARSEVLDSRGNVPAGWKTPLEKIAETPVYRTLQINTSLVYFLRAQAYFQTFAFTELRFLLLMYDFVVQNGSIGESHLKIYNNWLRQNPNANQEQKAFALLEARLTSVKDQYKADVRARKSTIIRGQGVVHQKSRNLPEEYCYDSQQALSRSLK